MSTLAESSSSSPPLAVKAKKKGETYQKVLDTAETVLNAAQAATTFIPDPAGSIVKGSIGVALEIVKIAKDVKSNKEDMGDLVDHIQEWTRIAADSLRGKSAEQISADTRDDLVEFSTRLKEVRDNIKDVLLSQGFFGRATNHASNQRKMIGYKEKLTKAFNTLLLRLIIDTNRVAEDIRTSGILTSLGGAKGPKRPGEDEVPKCIPDTRIPVLRTIRNWLDAPQDQTPRVLWLKGIAGSGKSSISASIAASRPHAIIFYFSRADQPRNDRVVLDLASQLAIGDATLKKAIVDSIENYRKEMHQDIDVASLEVQLEVLLFKPLRCRSAPFPSVPIIFDALDEWSTLDKASTLIRSLIGSNLLPFKVIITSRPEIHLIRAFTTPTGTAEALVTTLDLQEVDPSDIAQDLRKFIKHRLSQIVEAVSADGICLSPHWPNDEDIEKLADMSSGVLQLAATALRDIENGAPEERLHDILALGQFTDLDELYAQILDREFGAKASVGFVQQVLGFIVNAQTPMSRDVLAYLMADNASSIQSRSNMIYLEVLRKLPSMFRVPSDPARPIVPIHPTVVDYLTSQARGDAAVSQLGRLISPKSICVDPPAQHVLIVHACLSRMNRDLKEDILQIENASLMNSDLLVQEKIPARIPTGLRYSVLSWGYHLNHLASVNNELVALLSTFLEHKLLGWLEVLSLINELKYGISVVTQTLQWFTDRQLSFRVDPIEILSDLQRLIGKFFAPISASALHIYRSALFFTLPDTLLFKIYYVQSPAIRFLRRPKVSGNHTARITCTAFSPNSKHLASGSQDASVRVWDPTSGTLRHVLDGHISEITCIAFSPNGEYLASGSQDTTVRLWTLTAGILRHVLLGHTSWILSVAFGSDSKYLASSSKSDIRLWNPITGILQHVLPENLVGGGGCIAFSPDNRYLASGLRDYIQVWNPKTGAELWSASVGQQPESDVFFSGEACVAFSSDGKHLAFGSEDQIVRVWNPASGTLRHVLEGHEGWISCIAFSQNNRHLASRSMRSVIRVHDPESGALQWVLPAKHAPGNGRMDGNELAFSPDSKYLASLSFPDVLVWDMATGTLQYTLQVPRGDMITSIAFSADSKCLAFGTQNGSIWLGDPETGTPLQHQPEVLTGDVKCIAFNSNGRFLASALHDKIHVWDPASGTLCHVLDGDVGPIASVAFSSDNKQLASGSRDGTIRVWDTDFKSGAPGQHCLGVHQDLITHLVFDSDGKHLTAVSLSGFVAVYDLEAGVVQRRLNESLLCYAFRSDGKQVAFLTPDGTVSLWHIETGARRRLSCTGHLGSQRVNSFAQIVFSPDDKQLAYVCESETFLVRDLDAGISGPLSEDVDWMQAIVSSSNGGDKDNNWTPNIDVRVVQVWKPDILTRVQYLDAMTWVAFSSDGKHVASGGPFMNVIQMWNINDTTFERTSEGDERSPETISRYVRQAKLLNSFLRGTKPVNNPPHPPPPYPSFPYDLIPEARCFTITKTGWLLYRDIVLLWLPTEFRPSQYYTPGVLFSNGCLALNAPGLPLLYVSPSLLF